MQFRFLPSANRSADFRLLAVFIVLLFLTGGGSRADLASLIILRPLAVILTAWWVLRLDRAAISANRWFFAFASSIFALALLHVLPLPPGLWQGLPGRDIVARVDAGVGLEGLWRPLTLAPSAAMNALWSMFVPLAVGLGMVRLDNVERRAMLTVVLALGGLGLMLALAQVFAPSASALWFYRITNSGSPVGLFANRNHNAVFLASLVPLLLAWLLARGDERYAALKRAIAIVAVVLIGAVELASGSRAGLIAYAAAVALSTMLLPANWKPARRKATAPPKWMLSPRRSGLIAVAILGVLAAGLSLTFSQRDTALTRLSDSATGDFRPMIWSRTLELISDYLPLGSGSASFVETYRAGELPRDIMASYVNHAHNDYLEIALTLGIPGVLLVLTFLAFFALRLVAVWRAEPRPGSNVRLARASGIALVLLLGASVVDYPLRVPSLAAFAVLVLFWLALPRAGGPRRG